MTYWNGHGMNGWGIGLMTVGLARGEIHPDECRTRPDTLRGGDPPA
ncbi:hypothetical protein [Streptomyces sp. CBMA123]|nr:hypothetical protein [Streptomyces sp. CBMA123]